MQIGIIFSIAPLMRFLTPFLFLKLFELTKKVLHISLFVMGVCLPFLYISIENFLFFGLLNIVFGVATGLVMPYVETYSLVVLKKERYGRARLFGSIGFMLVVLILAKILSDNYIGLHFISFAILASIIFALIISRDSSHFSNEVQEKDDFSLQKNLALWLSLFLMQVSFGAFYSFFTIYQVDHGVSLETVSYLWSFGVICEIVLFYFQAKFLKFDLLKIIKFTVAMSVLRWLILYLFPESLTLSYVSQSFHAFSFALYHTATLSFLYIMYKNKNLAAQFYFGVGFGLGGFIGSLGAGYFYGDHLFLFSALSAFFALVFLFL